MKTTPAISLIGYECGLGAGHMGCEAGPSHLSNSQYLAHQNKFHWKQFLKPVDKSQKRAALPALTQVNHELAEMTSQLVQQCQRFLVIGGDHSCAIGTWSGVRHGLDDSKPIGLLWIDAHMDSHTFDTTPSDNINGMPLACLLGHGEPDLTSILSQNAKLQPENVCLVGTRSYESGEKALLEKLNVRIFYMDEINQRGLRVVMDEAFNIVSGNTAGFGISLDLDAVDPKEAPGVGTPASNGISGDELCQTLKDHCKNNNQLIGGELVEFNPELDEYHKTEKLLVNLMNAIFPNNAL